MEYLLGTQWLPVWCLLANCTCSSKGGSSVPWTEAYPDDAVSLRLSSSWGEALSDVSLDTGTCRDTEPSSTSTFGKYLKKLKEFQSTYFLEITLHSFFIGNLLEQLTDYLGAFYAIPCYAQDF